MAPATEESKMFTLREKAGFSWYNVTPSLRAVAPSPCLPLDIKDLLKGDLEIGLLGLL
jgi:hypothetical protein